MRKVITTSGVQISLFGGECSTSSPVASPASHLATSDCSSAQTTTVIYGPNTSAPLTKSPPPWVVPENVHGFVTWNDGQIFEQVCKDLESRGYEVAPVVLPASGIGAGHQRKRIFIVAYSAEGRLERWHHRSQERHREATYRPVPTLVEDRDWTEYAKSFIHRGIYGLSDRVDRTAALGDTIVPQVALQIFRAINLFEQQIA